MAFTPIDILDYVIDNEKEADFLVAITMHKKGYSIGEITDQKFITKDDKLFIRSKTYNIYQEVNDMDIIVAEKAGKYISAFLSRYNDMYQLHFLVHDCMAEDKERYEDDIAKRVVQYMILKTIKQLRLDTPKKVEEYIC